MCLCISKDQEFSNFDASIKRNEHKAKSGAYGNRVRKELYVFVSILGV